MHLKRLTALLLTLFLSVAMVGIPAVFAQTATVKVYSTVSTLGNNITYPDVRGTTFKIAVVVEDPDANMALYGFDIQYAWPAAYMHYTGYTVTVPKDTYSTVQPPSPYAGILNKGALGIQELANSVDEADSLPGAEPGTMAWFGFSQKGSVPGQVNVFNGSGTVVTMDFTLIDQPFDYEAPTGIDLVIHFTSTALADKDAQPIAHTVEDFTIKLWPRVFTYPASPMLKVMPETITGAGLGATFDVDVFLMGADGGDLDPFWDVAGMDFYLNFNATHIEGLSVEADPDDDFAAFFSLGVLVAEETINNTEGWVHVAFFGWGDHTPVFGTIRVATITFNVTYIHVGYPPPSSSICLENPLVGPFYVLDADGGIIDLSAPIGTDWTCLFPTSLLGYGFSATDWTDEDGDGELSIGDQLIILNTATGKWHDYQVDDITGTLKTTQLPFSATYEAFAMDCPTHKYSPWKKTADTGGYYNGYGLPYWTGNFTVDYPIVSVNSFDVYPQIGAPYTLVENVDYIVYPGTTEIELLTPLDEDVVNEFLGTMPDVDLGWPALANIASGISSVYIYMDNGTERYGVNLGYAMEPPAEWWFDPDFPYELESWWATGYVPGPWTWPDGTDIYANYTAPAWIVVDYNAEPDPDPYYFEFEGTYTDFLALGDPVGTFWQEVQPRFGNDWEVIGFTDADTSGDITVGDTLTMDLGGFVRDYLIDMISTDIEVIRKPCVQDLVVGDPYYTEPIIVDIAGFPHPERTMSPWYGRDFAIPLPNEVECATYTAPYQVLGRQIDVYVCTYPAPYGGQGPDNPADLFWPQKEVCLCANVTYNLWPEQNKDVAFEVIDPWGDTYTILYDRTDADGVARICFRLPWMCDDPLYYFGVWEVIATVDVACEHINDTMEFKYDYMVHVWKVTTDATSYAHGEYIEVTIEYGSQAMQTYEILLTATGLDETGVPFDIGYAWVTVGGARYCTYANGSTTITLYIPKWARAGRATIHVSALWPGLPQDGGVAQFPLVTVDVSIRAE